MIGHYTVADVSDPATARIVYKHFVRVGMVEGGYGRG